MKSFLVFILILASGYWCYDNYGQNVPVHTTLSHVDGRTMDVVLLSRGKTEVTFRRQSDGARLTCAIRDLNLISKCKVYWHFKPWSEGSLSREGSGEGSGAVKDLHMSGMDEMLADLHEELGLLRFRLNAAETNTQRRTTMNDIEATQLKINKIQLKQAEHQSHLQR